MWETWVSTVRLDRNSAVAMSGFGRPCAIRLPTFSSAGASAAQPGGRAAARAALPAAHPERPQPRGGPPGVPRRPQRRVPFGRLIGCRAGRGRVFGARVQDGEVLQRPGAQVHPADRTETLRRAGDRLRVAAEQAGAPLAQRHAARCAEPGRARGGQRRGLLGRSCGPPCPARAGPPPAATPELVEVLRGGRVGQRAQLGQRTGEVTLALGPRRARHQVDNLGLAGDGVHV